MDTVEVTMDIMEVIMDLAADLLPLKAHLDFYPQFRTDTQAHQCDFPPGISCQQIGVQSAQALINIRASINFQYKTSFHRSINFLSKITFPLETYQASYQPGTSFLPEIIFP